jgi:hypothetical protein
VWPAIESSEVKPYEDNKVTVALQLRGLHEAADRLEESTADRENAAGTFLPLFEVLNWATALDERIRYLWRPDGKKEKLGVDWPSRLGGADIVYAVAWARNIVHHQWADALRLDEVGHGLYPSDDLLPGDDVYPRDEWAWVWKTRADMPERKQRSSKTKQTGTVDGREAYGEHLEGRPAGETVRSLIAVIDKVVRLLEPWTITAREG